MEERELMIRGMLGGLMATLLDFFYPIQNFLLAIAIFATWNIVMGSWADTGKCSFKKAFTAIVYLIGYMALLLLSFATGVLMKQSPETVADFTSWITWVMIYFYVANILRNWNIKQPDNKVIELLYWVVTFKIVDKLDFLGEFVRYKREKDDETKQ